MHEEDARAWVAALINSVSHGDLIRVVVSPLSTHSFVNNYVSDLLASKLPRAVKASVQTRHPKWLPPPAGCMKVNVDAAISKNLGRASVAAVAHDQAGMFLKVLLMLKQPRRFAYREGLALASNLTLQSIRLALDNANVIRSLEETSLISFVSGGHVWLLTPPQGVCNSYDQLCNSYDQLN